MAERATRPQLAWAMAAAVASAAAGWVAFMPMRDAFFRHDDFGWLRVAQRWAAAEHLWPAITMGHAGFTLLYNLIYYACYRAGGLDPRIYWDVLLAAHALCSGLVALLCYCVVRSAVAAAAGGLLFALLFSHHEAVGWLASGMHVFALAFMLAAVLMWIAWRERGRQWWLAGALVFGAAALLTKASSVSLAALIALWELWLGPGGRLRALWWWALPYGLMVALRILYPPTHYVVHPGPGTYWPGLHVVSNLALCVPQMIVPDLRFTNYAALLRAHLPPSLASAAMVSSLAAIVALFAGSLLLLWRGNRAVRFAVAWCYVAFLPAALFRYDYAIAPRYLYIPSVGLAVAAGWWLDRMWQKARRPVLLAIGFTLVVAAWNIPPLAIMQAHRLRDSAVRRRVVAQALPILQRVRPGERVWLTGLTQPFSDLALGLRVFSGKNIDVRWAPSASHVAGGWVLVFSPDGALEHVLQPGGCIGRAGSGQADWLPKFLGAIVVRPTAIDTRQIRRDGLEHS